MAAKIKAIDMARKKVEELTSEGIVSFLFVLSEEGPELLGEQEFAHFMYDIFEEKKRYSESPVY